MPEEKIDLEDIEERISDLAGVRVICQFVEDIDKVVEIIRNRKDMEIKQERDYIREMKSSGYRSYHMIIYYTVDTLDGPEETPGGDSDPDHGHEFLGDGGAFSSVQV